MSWKEIWIAFKAVFIKEVLRFSRIWIQTILPPAITMSLYFIIFGNLIGRAIGKMGGFQYIDYIVPGLIMMSVITNSYSNVVSSFFSAKMHGNVQELLISPTPNIIILLGFVAGGVARGLGVGAVVTVVALFFTDLNIQHPIMTLLVVILTSFLFSTAGFINAIYAKSFDAVNIVPIFILTPLTYLGGVFYSVNMLPPFWRDVSLFNPILYMVNGFRYGILGISDITPTATFTLLFVFIGLLFSVAIFLLSRGIGLRD